MKTGLITSGFIILMVFLTSFVEVYKWGFFGHRRINRLAVFTLSPGMMPLYKNSIEYLTEHAVDADKRRYAVKDEAVRHFIDLDRWYKNGVPACPRKYDEALSLYSDFIPVNDSEKPPLLGSRSIQLIGNQKFLVPDAAKTHDTSLLITLNKFRFLINKTLLPISRNEESVIVSGKLINDAFNRTVAEENQSYQWLDTFSQHGILPFHLPDQYRKLVQAFSSKDHKSILRLSADIGHYLGDAHVPLHTTSNYNGQFTDQLGLHAFWESRIPELFADNEYDYIVGKAEYIKDIANYVWDVVIKSHNYVDSVLLIEKRLSLTFPVDQQYCFDERLGATVRTQCEAYAKAYQQAMKGMVESRMREAILSVGSVWYSAWIDAGQPKLTTFPLSKESIPDAEDIKIEKAFKGGSIIGRPEN